MTAALAARSIFACRMLAELGLDDEVVKTPPWWADEAGADLLQSAAELGLEGVVAKRLDSVYQPGARSRHWIKAPHNVTTEVIIAGWKPGGGPAAAAWPGLLGRQQTAPAPA